MTIWYFLRPYLLRGLFSGCPELLINSFSVSLKRGLQGLSQMSFFLSWAFLLGYVSLLYRTQTSYKSWFLYIMLLNSDVCQWLSQQLIFCSAYLNSLNIWLPTSTFSWQQGYQGQLQLACTVQSPPSFYFNSG